MARRMFNTQIVNSDPFLSMGQGAQNLYFHLGMHADDYGFVYPKQIMRMINAAEDDLLTLIAKKFIIPHEESGVIVVKHWHVNNIFRQDRRRPTTHIAAKAMLTLDVSGIYRRVGDMDAASRLLKERKKEIKNRAPSLVKETPALKATREFVKRGFKPSQ